MSAVDRSVAALVVGAPAAILLARIARAWLTFRRVRRIDEITRAAMARRTRDAGRR